MVKALQDIKVLDLSRVVAGPVCTSILGDLGADVIKVEHPENGDEIRSWYPPDIEKVGLYFSAANRNKRAITLDLKSEEGLKIIKQIVEEADVIVDNFKTGTMEKLGLGYDTLKKINHRIIQCSITGFGHTGPYKNYPGYDFIAQAMSGFMSVNGSPEGPPVKAGIAMADLYSGLYAVISILAAIQARTITGNGQQCDISLLDSMVASLLNIGTGFLNTGDLPIRYGNQHPTLVPYQSFSTKSDDIIVSVGNDEQFRKLCNLLNMEELAEDDRYRTTSARIINRSELIPIIQEALFTKNADEWLMLLNQAKISCGPINTLDKVFENEQVLERGMIQEVNHPVAGSMNLLGSPLKLSDTPVTIDRHPPLHGEHNEEVLSELGYNSDSIVALKKDKKI